MQGSEQLSSPVHRGDTQIGDLLGRLGIELSHLLRYFYGGFLLFVLARLVNPCAMGTVLKKVPWEIIALSALVIGCGIYAIHRGAIIPVHHLLLCAFLCIWEETRGVGETNSNSPTRWLGAMGVERGSRISAYTALRRSEFFSDKERRSFDLAHAESGLIVMTFEGFALSSYYTYAQPHVWRFAPCYKTLGILAAIFFFLSFWPGWAQHQVECRRFRRRSADVFRTLRDLGFFT
jgi:hypothetical protein